MLPIDSTLARAQAHLQRGEALQAELLLRQLVAQQPGAATAWHWLGELALQRGDAVMAREALSRAVEARPDDEDLLLALAETEGQLGGLPAARQTLVGLLQRRPGATGAWLALAELEQAAGHAQAALACAQEGLRRAQARGQWISVETTPPAWREAVLHWVARLNRERAACAEGVLAAQQRELGAGALQRFERCVAHYLGRAPELAPTDPQQRPKFLFFPGLPAGPYHDPALQPWLPTLTAATDAIRDEALGLLGHRGFEDFMGIPEGVDKSAYVGGAGAKPAWDAFFFYRHGRRYDENHALAPRTSAVLESIERCEVDGQAPEICFSLLAPGSHIKPHFGVTNTRLVLHLPLRVPADCALHVIGHGEHAWREGQPMMFDDSYEHEAWNRSAEMRMVLLMDCWNPHLTPPERRAVRAFAEAISAFERLPVEFTS